MLLRALAEILVGGDGRLDVDALDDDRRLDQRRVVLLRVLGHPGAHQHLVDRQLRRAGGRPLRHQLPLDLLRTGECGGVGGGLRVRAQHRGLADLEHQDADREQGEHHDQQARQDLSAFPVAHRGTER